MLGVIDILIYGLARHTELFRNLGVADAFSMQFQNLYDLVGVSCALRPALRGFGLLIFSIFASSRNSSKSDVPKFLLFAVGNQLAYSLDIKSGLWTLLYFQIDAVQILEFKYFTSSQTVVSGLLCREIGSMPWLRTCSVRAFAL